MTDAKVEPVQVVEMVEQYVESQLAAAEKYDNCKPLDESGVYSLHRLAASIYALGFNDAELAVMRREDAARRRDREAEKSKKAVPSPSDDEVKRMFPHVQRAD